MPLDTLMLLATLVLAFLLFVLLLVRRTFETLPVFCAYQVFSTVSAGCGLAIILRFPAAYIHYVIAGIALDAAFYLLVLFELAGSVLSFNRQDRSRRHVSLLLFVAAGLLLWPLAIWSAPSKFGLLWYVLSKEMHATTILEMAAVVALLTWSVLLRLRWPETDLRIVSGMGLWTMVGTAVLIVHSIGIFGGQYHWLDLLMPLSAILATLYWIHYFWIVLPAPKPVPRQWQPEPDGGR